MLAADRARAMATRITRMAGALAAILGLLALVMRLGPWHVSGFPWEPSRGPVAVGLLLGGCGLILQTRTQRQNRTTQALAAGAVLLAFAMLLSHTMVGTAWQSPALLAAAQAPPAAALCILLHGLALLLASRTIGPRWYPPVIATTGSAMLALALVSLLIRSLDMQDQLGPVDNVYLPTLSAVGLMALGIGLIGLATAQTPFHPNRRTPWLPASIGFGLGIFTVVVWWELLQFDRLHAQQIAATAAIATRTHVVSQLRTEVDRGERMARRWEISGGTPRELWEADAAGYIGDLPSLIEILWLDDRLIPRWGMPFSANEPQWSDQLTSPRLHPSLLTARQERRPTLSPSYSIADENLAFLICLPLHIGDDFDGLLVTVVSVTAFLEDVFRDAMLQDYAITISDSGRIVYGPGPVTAEDTGTSATLPIKLDGLDWTLCIRPLPGNPVGARSTLPEVTLIVGLILAALVMLSVRLGQMAAERARELETMNAALERRVSTRTAALQNALAKVERSNEELEQFAYVASHDLQEPLRMISSYVQLLARRYKGRLDPDADDFINFAVDGAERMKRLINDLLAYSRLGTHGKPFRLVDMNDIARQTLSNLEFALRDASADVSIPPLPAVYGDETQLLQLLQNLIANAIKFHGNAPPRVTLAATREGPHWHFTLQDNGIGIDPQYAERIFIIFRRLHAQDAYPGTGIGLAVCKKIVERHGGRIWVTSQPGQGSIFHFLLPAEALAPPPPEE